MGSKRDKHKVKNPIGKSSGNAAQRAQWGKGRVETNKKLRGEGRKIGKDNSYSSVELDMRSSDIFLRQMGSFSGISIGIRSERSSNYDGENSNKAQAPSREVGIDYCNENVVELTGVSLDDVAAEEDPLVKSIISLQSVQVALEKETQKIGEIGREPFPLSDDFINCPSSSLELTAADTKIHESNSSGQLQVYEMEQKGFKHLEFQLIKLNQKVHLLESKLEEVSAMLRAKTSRVVELEAILSRTGLLKEESANTLQYPPKNRVMEIEVEVEGLWQQKIEAEVEYLLIARTTQRLDQISLFEEQKSLAEDQNQMLHKVRDMECKTVALKNNVEELEASCIELSGTEEVLKMQSRLCKRTLCFFVQLVLLLLVFALFLVQLLTQSFRVVPT